MTRCACSIGFKKSYHFGFAVLELDDRAVEVAAVPYCCVSDASALLRGVLEETEKEEARLGVGVEVMLEAVEVETD